MLRVTLGGTTQYNPAMSLCSIFFPKQFCSLRTAAIYALRSLPKDFQVPSVMIHTGVRTNRKFERYQDEDRRDEWLRGRDEKDARSMYMMHTAGYGGHLPEYRYHFGRTFHVIEEDLPMLTKPKEARPPVAPDTFGPPLVLRSSRMSEHHYRFS